MQSKNNFWVISFKDAYDNLNKSKERLWGCPPRDFEFDTEGTIETKKVEVKEIVQERRLLDCFPEFNLAFKPLFKSTIVESFECKFSTNYKGEKHGCHFELTPKRLTFSRFKDGKLHGFLKCEPVF